MKTLFHSSIRVCGLQSNFKAVATRSKAARSISTNNFSVRNLKSNILPPRYFRLLPSSFELFCRDKQFKTSVIANSCFSVAQKNYYASGMSACNNIYHHSKGQKKFFPTENYHGAGRCYKALARWKTVISEC